MARIRTIKPEFWADEKLAPRSPITRLVFLGLVSQADDHGRLVDNIRLLDGLIFPETEHSCAESLEELEGISVIERGRTSSGQRVIQIVGWEKHQRVDKPSSRAALPPIDPESSRDTPETLARTSRDSREPPEPRAEAVSGDSGDSPETLARSSRDPRVTTYDLRPTTYDRRPTTFAGRRARVTTRRPTRNPTNSRPASGRTSSRGTRSRSRCSRG